MPGRIECAPVTNRSVEPLGSALATYCPENRPPAPGLASITNGRPSVPAIFLPVGREPTSACPPEAVGMMMLHGPGGMAAPCAHADVPDAPTAGSAAADRMNLRRVWFSPHALPPSCLAIVA